MCQYPLGAGGALRAYRVCRGVLFSEALAAEGAVLFARRANSALKGKTGGQLLPERKKPQLAEDKKPGFRHDVTEG